MDRMMLEVLTRIADNLFLIRETLECMLPKPPEEDEEDGYEENLIDRQAAIDAVEAYFGDLPIVVHHDMLQLIKALPSAQPEPRWIPVGERLPGSSGNYLVSVKGTGWNCEEYVVDDIAYWDSSAGFHKAGKVVAWMPLPRAYKEDSDG